MKDSKIEWCDHTFNPWIGCTKVSPGCAHCYAETLMDARYGKVKWGKGQARERTSKENWKKPLQWNRAAEPCSCESGDTLPGGQCNYCGLMARRPRVFCASLADWLDEEVPIEWLADLLRLIYETPNLDWLLLTKRPGNFKGRVTAVMAWMNDQHAAAGYPSDAERAKFQTALWMWRHEDYPPENVWIGTSVEDQARADERIPELLEIPAKVRFLSVEPMLGKIDLRCGLPWDPEYAASTVTSPILKAQLLRKTRIPGVDWVIFGGESGAGARPCSIEWIRDGVRQCRAAGVAPFVKQLGAFSIEDRGSTRRRSFWEDKKGGDMSEWEEGLRVREFPQGKAKG